MLFLHNPVLSSPVSRKLCSASDKKNYIEDKIPCGWPTITSWTILGSLENWELILYQKICELKYQVYLAATWSGVKPPTLYTSTEAPAFNMKSITRTRFILAAWCRALSPFWSKMSALFFAVDKYDWMSSTCPLAAASNRLFVLLSNGSNSKNIPFVEWLWSVGDLKGDGAKSMFIAAVHSVRKSGNQLFNSG